MMLHDMIWPSKIQSNLRLFSIAKSSMVYYSNYCTYIYTYVLSLLSASDTCFLYGGWLVSFIIFYLDIQYRYIMIYLSWPNIFHIRSRQYWPLRACPDEKWSQGSKSRQTFPHRFWLLSEVQGLGFRSESPIKTLGRFGEFSARNHQHWHNHT